MQVNMLTQLNNQSSNNVNFKQVYRVRSCTIGDLDYNHKHCDEIYDAARALVDALLDETLSPELRVKFCSLFNDFEKSKFAKVARTNAPRYKQEILILTADDAQKYCDARTVEKNTGDDNTESQWILSTMLPRAWVKKLKISAEQNGKKLIITDIERLKKENNTKKKSTVR